MSFAEALAVVKAVPDAFCLAELKSGGGEESILTANLAAKVTKESGATPEDIIFISFDLNNMIRIKELLPSFRCLHVMMPEADVAMDEVKTALDAGMDGVDLWAIPDIVTQELIDYVHSRKKSVAVWVWDGITRMKVDTAKNMQVLSERGVDYFTTDLPDDILVMMEGDK